MDGEVTHYYVCIGCGKACDAVISLNLQGAEEKDDGSSAGCGD